MILLRWEPYSNTGTVVPDGLVESFVENIVNLHENDLKTAGLTCDYNIGNELILNYFRVAIQEGKLDHEDLQLITYNDSGDEVLIIFDKSATMDSLNGYPNFWEDSLNRVLKW